MQCRQRYTVSADGASLAYYDEGEGPAVVLTNGFSNSTLYWEPLRKRLRRDHRVIRWDYRGHGRSGPARQLETMTVEGCADDLRRVMDAAGVEGAVLAGFSFGCQIILEGYRQYSDRVRGLIPVLGPYERPFDTLLHPSLGPLVYEFYERVDPEVLGAGLKVGALGSWLRPVHAMGKALGFIGPNVSMEEMEPFYTHLATLDIPTWYAMGRAAQDHSARTVLDEVQVPALVVAGGADRFSPGELGREMARRIPQGELLWLEGATHTGLFDAREEIERRVAEFLDSLREESAPGQEESVS